MIRAILIMVVLVSHSYAAEPDVYIAKQLVFGATLMKDYRQTIKIAKSKGEYTEQNDLVGRRPHPDNVRIYMAGCIIGHTLVSYLLYKYDDSKVLVSLWQDAWAVVETYYGEHNDDIGLNQNSSYSYRVAYSIKF